MASSYSTDLKLELIVTGEKAGQWGDITNTNLNLVQQAIGGFESISIAGGAQTTTLVMTDGALSNARNAVIKLTGAITGNQVVTIPTGIEKTYIVSNGTTGAFTVEFKQAGGTGSTFSTTDKGIKILFADGTNINAVDLSTLSGQIVAAQITTSTITTNQLATGAVLAGNIANSTITTTQLATGAVLAGNIATSTITQSKLASNSVGPDQLIATAVTAGAYTAASITVDADGRITAASSGSAGAGGYNFKVAAQGPASGTYTATPNANKVGAYIMGGGGGGGMRATGGQGGAGGSGGYGFFATTLTQPFAQPFSVGVGGNAGVGPGAGGAGGSTVLTNIGTATGGGGGPGSSTPQAAAGTATGAFTDQSGNTAALFDGRINNISVDQGGNFTVHGRSGPGMEAPGTPMTAGSPGRIVIFDNSGT